MQELERCPTHAFRAKHISMQVHVTANFLSQIPLKMTFNLEMTLKHNNDLINGTLAPKTLQKWYYTWF